MKNKLLLAWIVLTLAVAACVCNGSNGGSEASGSSGSPPGSTSIGKISLVTNDVEHNKKPVTSSELFYNHDSVGLLNGGEGRLDFIGGLALNLFNDSLVGDIQSEAASGSSILARMRLEFGGFTGSLTASGKSVSFTTPNGAIITVYGTDFFIVYDPSTSTTAAGNFGGRIEVQVGNGPAQPVPGGTFRQVFAGGEISPEQPLTFSQPEFEERSRQSGSPVAAFNELTVTIIEPEPIPVEDLTPPTFELVGLDPPSIVYGPECPGSVGETRLTMFILDESQIANAMVEWELNGVFEQRPMERIDDQTFTVLIGPLQDFGVLNIVVRAEDMFGNAGQSEPIQVKVAQCIG
jgi:hypothetical protein